MSELIRVLYIDDDPGLGRLLQKSLHREGIEVHHVTTSAEGLARLTDDDFDILALDHTLEGETGLDVMPLVQRMDDPPPIIYVTGSDDVQIAVSAMKAGALDYVWKDTGGHYRELLGEAVKSAVRKQQLKRDQERAQREIAEAKERAELLLSEMHHRVSNSLAIVASLAALQASALSDPAAQEALHEMRARILAISNIHRRLHTSTDVRHVELDAYLANLIGDLEATWNKGAVRHAIVLEVDEGLRPVPDRAISLGVVVTELITNAFKYAYPDDKPGEIRLFARRREDGQISVSVEDDGIGWRGEGEPRGSGLGTRIIGAMSKSLGTEVSYDPGHAGTRVLRGKPDENERQSR